MYVNTKTGEVATFGVSEVTKPLSEWKEENVIATYQSKYEGVELISFGNDVEINGKEALVAVMSFKTPKGNDVISVLVMVTDEAKNYIISLTYGMDKTDGSLPKNLEACINSIKIK